MLENVCAKIPGLKFICIDTICEHLRGTEIGYGERKRIVSQMLMGLLKVANKFGIAIVIVNNMRPGKREFKEGEGDQPDSYGQPTKPEPLFGEDLFQAVTNRVMLERDQHSTEDNIIRAKLVKGSVASFFSSNPTSHFQITEKGITNII